MAAVTSHAAIFTSRADAQHLPLSARRQKGRAAFAAAPRAEQGAEAYRFKDDGSEVEVAVTIPAEYLPFSVSQLGVDTQEDSLLVTLSTPTKLVPLLVARPLFSRVQLGETVWFLEDDDVVISLKKADENLKWPGLVDAGEALAIGVARLLKSTSLYIVGDSSEANSAVAARLATALGYVPLETQQVVEQLLKAPVDALVSAGGAEQVADTEAMVLASATSNVRCAVSTIGGRAGAATLPAGWRSIYGGVSVWIDCASSSSSSSDEEAMTQTQKAYEKADVKVAVQLPPGDSWPESATEAAVEAALKAIKRLIDSQPKLPGNKSLYVKLGCRGDWPDIQPPGWAPPDDSGASITPGSNRNFVVQ
eukprot:jgi/Mesen1/1087/ME000123S00258